MKERKIPTFLILLMIVLCMGVLSVHADLSATSKSIDSSKQVNDIPLINQGLLKNTHTGVITDQYMIVTSQPPVVSGIANTIVCNSCSKSEELAKNETILSKAAVISKINVINAEILKNDWDWVAGQTSVLYRSEETRERMRGLKHETPVPVKKASLQEPTVKEVRALPTSFSWSSNNGNYLTPVRDQGSCGSCWAFAITAAYESYYERLKHNPNLNPNFAEQILVSCASDQDGCDGGLISAMKYLVNKPLSGKVGTVNEGTYRYVAKETTCKKLGTSTRYKAGRWAYVAGGNEWAIPSVNAIKNAVYTKGPVVVGVYADDNFDAYTSGIFSSKPTTSGYYTNHAVVIYGWGVYKGKTYWRVKNSWGTSWGEAGHFRIYTNQNRIGEGAAYFSTS